MNMHQYIDTVSKKTLYVWRFCKGEIECTEYTLDEDGDIPHREDGPAYSEILDRLDVHIELFWLYGEKLSKENFIRYQEIVHLTLT